MKRTLAILLSLLLILAVLPTASTEGDLCGTAQGFGGPVTVSLTVEDGLITAVDIQGEKETPGIGQKAIEQNRVSLIGKPAAADSVDSVSQATVTSTAIKEAMAQALSGAETAADLSFTPGTYTASAPGYGGDVQLAVTFSETALEDIQLVSASETEHVGDSAYVLFVDMVQSNSAGVDSVSGATLTSRAIRSAVSEAAKQAQCTNLAAFEAPIISQPDEAMEVTYDVVIVGGGGAGIAAAAQAARDGHTVLLIEKNSQLGGNTLVSGGQYQSVMPYLVWDAADPDAATGIGFDGQTYNKVMSVSGCIDQLRTILDWNETPFDTDWYKTNPFVAGDTVELSKHGVHAEYLPVLKALKDEIRAYLAWAQPKLDAGLPESRITLFSTLNLHIFQTYYGGLRPSADGSEWCYGDIDLVRQFIEDGQALKPWLEEMGSTFVEDTQPTLIGALWYRENEFIGANVDTDGDGEKESYNGRWGSYFVAPMTAFLNANEKNSILLETTATELIVNESGRVIGVKAVKANGTDVTAYAAKGVILATGGYAANIQKVLDTNIYWSSEYLTANTKTTNRSSLMGDGIDMAQRVGAATTGMGFTQMMPISWVDNGNLAFGSGAYAVYINPTTGKRYVDEGSERDVLSLAAYQNGMELNGAKGVFVEIYNADQPMPAPIQLGNEDYEDRYYLRKASELGELYAQLGILADAEVTLETLRKYDMAVMTGGEFEDVGKSIAQRTVGDVQLLEDGTYDIDSYDLDNTMLRVRLLAPSTHHTMGGLRVDIHRHVLDENGRIIEGLYAAGEVTGGIHGGNRLGGNAIVEVFVSGRTAAMAITEDSK